jgi:hypothetical protein
MNGRDQVLGIVENRRFKLLEPSGLLGDVLRLTSIQRQEARPPESGEPNLAEYEGKAIMVTGYIDSSWIYGAAVIDQAGPILTAVVQKVFGGIGEELANV